MKSIYFRAFEEGDHVLINKWRNDPKIQALTGGNVRYVSSEMEREWVRSKMMNNRRDMYFAICLNDGAHRMICYCSINNIDYLNRKAEQGGLVLGEEEFCDGMTWVDSITELIDYEFMQLNMNRVYGTSLAEHKTTRVM